MRLEGAYLIKPEPVADERGFFARTFCEDEFAAHGLVARHFSDQHLVQQRSRHGARHAFLSRAPHAETKLVRCTAGAIYDVIVDLRAGSATYLDAIGIELSADNRQALYIPVGLAHGFQTLTDDAEVLYMIDAPYVASAARGIRWNDPAVKIDWPEPITVISERDLQFPDWKP